MFQIRKTLSQTLTGNDYFPNKSPFLRFLFFYLIYCLRVTHNKLHTLLQYRPKFPS